MGTEICKIESNPVVGREISCSYFMGCKVKKVEKAVIEHIYF